MIEAPQTRFLAPNFSLPNLDGDLISLSAQRGQVVVINFWATWCPPCRAEMPALQRIYSEYQDRGLIVLAINLTSQDRLNAINPFIQNNNLTFPILLDQEGIVSHLYKVTALPTTFFIN
ncbi:MAG: TlpA disulfide reductase family protein [Chloroflexota bacterium]